MIIDSAEYTCAGGHDVNEDSYLRSTDRGIFIVADGLGGHSDGEVASSAAIGYFKENCFGGYTSERITELLEGANAEVLSKGDGGKTTVAAAFIENGHFVYANVGDSRVYFFRGNRLIAQTKDHSVCQASVDMGIIRPEDIRGSEDRSRLLKVLGSEEKLNIKKHYEPIRLENGDAFLVCSDGFWDYVYESEMEADLLKSDSADVWLKYMLKRHILRGQNKGDNYTAVCGIIHLDESDVFEDLPTVQQTISPAVSKKKRPVVRKRKSSNIIIAAIIAIAAVIVIAAAAVILLKKGSGESDGISDTPAITSTSAVTAVTTEEITSPVKKETVVSPTVTTAETTSQEDSVTSTETVQEAETEFMTDTSETDIPEIDIPENNAAVSDNEIEAETETPTDTTEETKAETGTALS